ncbi:hypothetical protein Bca52824_053981 [Brassica carinata]|uniref:Uncharacterized protein n=1 Tax=Brassica carinata TaxID=52824 RepID=A0A8X7R6K9_BRACI|nr:hypothetical protein Bca52824_053981 [Brassica carinata]
MFPKWDNDNTYVAVEKLVNFMVASKGFWKSTQECWAVEARCVFRPPRCNSDFAAACSAAEVIASLLPCSVRIGRSGFLEYQRLQRFEDLAFLLMDQEAVGVSLGR